MTTAPKTIRFLIIALASLVGGFLSYAAYANIAAAQFTGPPCTVGNCSGAIGINSTNDLSFGTSTATTSAKVYIVTSTANNAYGLIVRGKIYSSTGGYVFPDGTIQTTAGSGQATTTAANVTPGYFNSTAGTGGNYSFPASLSIATSTAPSGGALYVNGNVGIGTAAPVSPLHVLGMTTGDPTLNNSMTISDDTAMAQGVGGLLVFSGRAATGATTQYYGPYIRAAKTNGTSGNYSFDLAVGTRANGGSYGERFRITDAGNVGIGTAAPTAAAGLTIGTTNGGLYIPRTETWLDFNATGQNHLGGVTYFRDTDANPVNAAINGAGTGNTYFSAAGGNVGIGTTTPESALTVAGASNKMLYNSGTGILNLFGPVTTLSQMPRMHLGFNGDADPGLGFLMYNHDNLALTFDSYHNGTSWVSSHSGSNFSLYKTGNELVVGYNSGIAKGSTFAAFNLANGVRFSSAGALGIGGAPGSAKLYVNGNVGVGTTGPDRKVDVLDASNPQLRLTHTDGTVYTDFQTTSAGYLSIAPSNGRVGIGTSTPNTLLSVGTTTTGLVATFGGGTGKINVGTIDPLYTIGGKRYATYLPAMTGQKEETTGILEFRESDCTGLKIVNCKLKIAFEDLPEGSDLWLFAKTTNVARNKDHFDRLAVVLTPAFRGDVWYEKDATRRTVTIHASPDSRFQIPDSLELSYRLTAPRFDSAQWQNRATDSDEGFNLDKLLK